MPGFFLFMLSFNCVRVSLTLLEFFNRSIFPSLCFTLFLLNHWTVFLLYSTLLVTRIAAVYTFLYTFFPSLCITPIIIVTCISCAITLNTALWWNVYLLHCNAFWQPANIWEMLDSSFLEREHSISSSNPQRARFCGDAKVLYVAPRQNKTKQEFYFRRLCQVISLSI